METDVRACDGVWLQSSWPPFLFAAAAELAWLSALAWLALR